MGKIKEEYQIFSFEDFEKYDRKKVQGESGSYEIPIFLEDALVIMAPHIKT